MSTPQRKHLHLPNESQPAKDLRLFAAIILKHLRSKYTFDQKNHTAALSMSGALKELGYSSTAAPSIMGFLEAAKLALIVKRQANSRRLWYVFPGDVSSTYSQENLEAAWAQYVEEKKSGASPRRRKANSAVKKETVTTQDVQESLKETVMATDVQELLAADSEPSVTKPADDDEFLPQVALGIIDLKDECETLRTQLTVVRSQLRTANELVAELRDKVAELEEQLKHRPVITRDDVLRILNDRTQS